jgi:hypothetical protein
MLLKQPDVVADRCWRKPKLFGCILKAQSSRCRFKGAQRAKRRQASHCRNIDEFLSSIT